MIPVKFAENIVNIPSRFTEIFGPLLYHIVLANRPRVIVETGTCWGYLTAWLALGAQQVGARFHTIDFYNEAAPHVGPDDEPQVSAYLEACGVRDNVTLHRGEANYVLWGLANSGLLDDLGLAMLDDEHARGQITRECEQMLPYLCDWGLICGHDVFDQNYIDMACGYRDLAVAHRLEQIWLTESSGLIIMQKRPSGHET
jgi:predicted O-methyltransferase YrrM